MPLYEYRCEGCGFIDEVFVRGGTKNSSHVHKAPCPMKCKSPIWSKTMSAPQEFTRMRSESRFPHATHMRDPTVHWTKHGPVLGTKRVVATSRAHMEKLMDERGYVYYETPADGGAQAKFGQMPADIKRLETENPMVRKYLDMKAQGRIPSEMVLTEEQLKERFHVE